MSEEPSALPSVTAFDGHRQVASGGMAEVAMALRRASESESPKLVLVFEDASGRQIDLDLSGSLEDVARRFGTQTPADASSPDLAPPRGRGRPKLGVVGREVTLLPRHWAWLQTQRGGPSATLRRLVDAARAQGRGQDSVRQAQDAINRFISSVAGDLGGFEEANRALYRGDRDRFESEIAGWPADLRRYVERWAASAFGSIEPSES